MLSKVLHVAVTASLPRRAVSIIFDHDLSQQRYAPKLDLNITEKFVTNVITIINVDLEYLLLFLYQIYSPVLTFYSIYLMLNKLYDLPYLYLFHYIYRSQNCNNFVKCVKTISKFKNKLFIYKD